MRRLFFNSLCLFAWAFMIWEAGATTVKRLSLEELTARSELIVLGHHLETKSVWVGRLLVTRTTVAVGELLKGQAPPSVIVDILGGIDMNRRVPIGMNVPGAPRIHSGEQVILFLSRREGLTGTREYEIVGFSQGKFSITKDATGSRVRAAASGAAMPLAQFKAEIQRYVSGHMPK
jgi:hypothetical protein